MKRAEILEQAFKLFAKQGYISTSMQQIGDAVGLDKSSLYSHFKNKYDLFKEVLDLEFESVEENIFKKINSYDVNTLREIFCNFVNYFIDRDKLLFWKGIYMIFSSKSADDDVAELIKNTISDFDTEMRKAINAVNGSKQGENAKYINLFFFVVTQGFLDWFMLQDTIDKNTIDLTIEVYDRILKLLHPDLI